MRPCCMCICTKNVLTSTSCTRYVRGTTVSHVTLAWTFSQRASGLNPSVVAHTWSALDMDTWFRQLFRFESHTVHNRWSLKGFGRANASRNAAVLAVL